MLETALAGALADNGSIRANVTDAAFAAFAFDEMNTRPVEVAAQSVLAFEVLRASQLTLPPLLELPYGQVGVVGAVELHVRRPFALGSPSLTQSPQTVFGANAPGNRLQFDSS